MKIEGINLRDLPVGTNILDLDIPPALELSIDTGVPWLNESIGGGATPSSAWLVTGWPGAGKTTGMIQCADAVTGAGHIALFNTAEESPLQVRKVVKRLGLKNGFEIGQNRLVPEILEHAEKLRAMNPGKRLFMFLDSLQTLDDGKYANGSTNQNTQVRAAEMITSYCKAEWADFPIAFIIGQVRKDGTFAGKELVKHAVDGHAHLSMETDEKSEYCGYRLWEIQKNRFGPAGGMFVLKMESNGLHVARNVYGL